MRGEQKARRGSLIRRCWQFVKDQVSRRRGRSGSLWNFLTGWLQSSCTMHSRLTPASAGLCLPKRPQWTLGAAAEYQMPTTVHAFDLFSFPIFFWSPRHDSPAGPSGCGPHMNYSLFLVSPMHSINEDSSSKMIGRSVDQPPPAPPLTRNTQWSFKSSIATSRNLYFLRTVCKHFSAD